MATPPTAAPWTMPPCVQLKGNHVHTAVPMLRGYQIFNFDLARHDTVDIQHWARRSDVQLAILGRSEAVNQHSPTVHMVHHPLLRTLLGTPAVAPETANCYIHDSGISLTRDLVTDSVLTLKRSPVTVLAQWVPQWWRACSRHICDEFLIGGSVPRDNGGEGGRTAMVDGYVTLPSLARVVCTAPYCSHCCVIGCGYGETLALLCMARGAPGLGFEPVPRRRSTASQLVADLRIGDRVELHGAVENFTGAWPSVPSLIWTNNLRFNDDVKCDIPQALLEGPSFPADGSTLLSMVPFAGEETVPVCVCGGCYEGFCDTFGAEGCYILRSDAPHQQLPRQCGPVSGFWDKRTRPDGVARAMLRLPPTGIALAPFGAGSGVYDACGYQLFASATAPPTPHPGLTYGCIVLTHPDDLTDALRAKLRFVETSPVVDGDLMECSLVFHGVDGEQLGIDAAVAFTATEPGSPPVVYAYRTLALVRECGMPGVLRLNQDIIVAGMQGKSFINQVNIQTAQVIRQRFPRITHVIIEPDRDVSYHVNYLRHGFLWRLQDPPLAHCAPPERFANRPYRRYREQIQLDPERYETMWFRVPEEDKAGGPATKRAKTTGV
jgi:hypothetical protein